LFSCKACSLSAIIELKEANRNLFNQSYYFFNKNYIENPKTYPENLIIHIDNFINYGMTLTELRYHDTDL
jgi:hypothetical protein